MNNRKEPEWDSLSFRKAITIHFDEKPLEVLFKILVKDTLQLSPVKIPLNYFRAP